MEKATERQQVTGNCYRFYIKFPKTGQRLSLAIPVIFAELSGLSLHNFFSSQGQEMPGCSVTSGDLQAGLPTKYFVSSLTAKSTKIGAVPGGLSCAGCSTRFVIPKYSSLFEDVPPFLERGELGVIAKTPA